MTKDVQVTCDIIFDTVSVVVPVYNSSLTLPPLVERLNTVLSAQVTAFEIILVNDGSQDTSWEIITKLAHMFPWVCGINLMRNYGQHNALLAGIRTARHSVIVTMDDDLQHLPEEIPTLLQKLEEGYDVVYGIPHALQHSLWRNLSSKLIKRLVASMMGIKNTRDINDFRAFRTELRKAFASYQSPALLLDVLLSWGTTRFAAVKVTHEPRRIGKSNYTFAKLFNYAVVLLTGFSTLPLRLSSLIGFSFTGLGVLALVYVVGDYFVEQDVPGFPFLASIICLFSGAQLFALGIIGEYIASIHGRTLERPTYVIRTSIQSPTVAETKPDE